MLLARCPLTTHTHIPLAAFLFKSSAATDAPPLEMVRKVSSEMFERLTLRSLLNLCTVCRQKPTSAMLAIALQNSIPSLTGLPLDNPDPAFYIDIAKRFFDREYEVPNRRKMDMYDVLVPERFFRGVVSSLEDRHGCFPTGLDSYIHEILYFKQEILRTKKGREFIR